MNQVALSFTLVALLSGCTDSASSETGRARNDQTVQYVDAQGVQREAILHDVPNNFGCWAVETVISEPNLHIYFQHDLPDDACDN